jgi:hypothetical protein
MSPADSRVGLKISIAYGFNQLLCHFYNFLFPHCKAGGDTNNNNNDNNNNNSGNDEAQLLFPESLSCTRQTLPGLSPHLAWLTIPA